MSAPTQEAQSGAPAAPMLAPPPNRSKIHTVLVQLAVAGGLLLLCSPLILRPATTALLAAFDGAISHPFDAEMAVGLVLALSLNALQLGALALIWREFVAESINIMRLERGDPRLLQAVQERYALATSEQGFRRDEAAHLLWRAVLARPYLPASWLLIVGSIAIPTYLARHATYTLAALVALPLALSACNGIRARRALTQMLRGAHPELPVSRWTAADIKDLASVVVPLVVCGSVLSVSAGQSAWSIPRAEDIPVVRDARGYTDLGARVRAAARAALPDKCAATEETLPALLDTTASDEQLGREMFRAAGEHTITLGPAGTIGLHSHVLFTELLGVHRTTLRLCGSAVDGPMVRFAPDPQD